MQLLKSLKLSYTKHVDPYYQHTCILWFLSANFPYIFYHSILLFLKFKLDKKIHIAVKIVEPFILVEDDASIFLGRCATELNNGKPQWLEMLFTPCFCISWLSSAAPRFPSGTQHEGAAFSAKEKYTRHHHNTALKLLLIMSISQDTHPNLVSWNGKIHSSYKRGQSISNKNTI